MIDRACISLNNNCNLKCKYCHFKDKQKDFNSFDYESMITIIDHIHDYCLKNSLRSFKLGIVGSGEPMLKSELILSVLKYVKERKYDELKMYTITNGTLLSTELLKKFYEYRNIMKICISLDGFEELHNYGRSSFDKVMEGVDNYKKVFKVSPSINATVNYMSYKDKEKLISFFKTNNLLDVTFSKLIGCFDKDLYITNEQFNDFMEYVFKSGIDSRQFKKGKKYDCTMYGRLCGVGRTNIFITPEGIYPCGRFYKDNRFLLGEYSSNLFDVEKRVNNMEPVEDGKCYYIEKVEVK